MRYALCQTLVAVAAGTATLQAIPPQEKQSATPVVVSCWLPVDSPSYSLPYEPTIPPNPGISWGIVGIIRRPYEKGPLTHSRAATLGKYALTMYRKSDRWQSMSVYVFATREDARLFGDFQARRRGAPLKARDFQQLTSLWPKVKAVSHYSPQGESIYYPSKNPRGWWKKLPQ